MKFNQPTFAKRKPRPDPPWRCLECGDQVADRHNGGYWTREIGRNMVRVDRFRCNYCHERRIRSESRSEISDGRPASLGASYRRLPGPDRT